MFILYHVDTNSIHARAVNNRQDATIRDAWVDTSFETLKAHGEAPSLHILDNEFSDDIKQVFLKHKVTFQRVPPHIHRRNAAERAIGTYKNHLISGLCIVDSSLSMQEWDRLLLQCTLTLNSLRASRQNPFLSAYDAVFGVFNFAATPLTLPGTKVLIHLKPDQVATFGTHAIDSWYVGPFLEDY